jgi:SNF2 family DNA or RNA helicase
VHFDRREASAADVWRAARSGRRTAPLSDDSLGLIPAAWFKRIRELDLDAVPERTRVLFDSRNVAPLESLLNTASKLEMEDSARRLFDFHKGRIEGGALEIPPTLRGVLRPYQEKGFFWMEALHRYAFSGILADDMGLGKTVQVLALLEAIRLKTPEKRCLLVVPTSLIHNWELEIRRFTPGLQAHVHAGTKQERSPHAFGESFLVITSYALLRIDCRYFRPVPWHYVVLDESQAIKNPDARITASVKSLHAEHRLSLTGTPVENRAEDLWSQFDFLMPGFLGDRSAFRRGRGGPEPEGLESLARRCRPFLLRRTKDGVLDELPPKTEVPLFCEFEPEQRALYVRTLAETRRRFRAESDPADPGSSRTLHLLEAILRLRQIACHPALSGAEGADSLESGKHEQVMETAREILSEGHKILIFSQFARHLKLLRTRFRKEGIPSHYLDGATRDRAGVIHAFKNDPRPSVFFLSLKAGGQGLNLTEASYVFLLDPWWNPAVENQAMDRCHRMGQKRPVTVYRFLTRDSIEEKVVALQDKKRELETALVHASGESMDLPLDREALEKLLEI